MGYTYTTIDGSRVEVHVAAAFGSLRAAFRAQWGLDLLVTDGTRTRAEQEALYRAYLAGGTLAAAPGYSNHEEDGTRGPRALDVHDSGADAGVVTYGTPRANWLRIHAPEHGFDPAGCGFSQTEPWHIEYVGALDGPVPSKDMAETPAPTPSEEDDMLALRITLPNGVHLATLAPGVFSGLIGDDNPEWVKNVVRSDDAWTEVSGDQALRTLLHKHGVAIDCYRPVGKDLEVRDARTGLWSRGGRWSAADAVLGALGKA